MEATAALLKLKRAQRSEHDDEYDEAEQEILAVDNTTEATTLG